MIITSATILVYILIISFLCWSVVSSKGHLIFKCFGVTVALWYSFSFFYITKELKGWPTEKSLPDKAIIISFKVVEPDNDNAGAFYFWCNIKPNLQKDLVNLLNPAKVFNYAGQVEPRAYKLPYDRELHKRLLEAQKQQRKIGGSFMQVAKERKKGKKGGKGNMTEAEKIGFKIINPIELLTKSTE